jgi:hypothetical protein
MLNPLIIYPTLYPIFILTTFGAFVVEWHHDGIGNLKVKPNFKAPQGNKQNTFSRNLKCRDFLNPLEILLTTWK